MVFVDELNECPDFACIFSIVKKAVEATLDLRRTGLILGLSNLPVHVGAYHTVDSNFIVLNKRLLKKIIAFSNKRLVNSYIFHILLHEYIHSLGFLDERKTKFLTYKISETVLGEGHPSTIMAKNGINFVFPIEYTRQDFTNEKEIEIINDFETENMSYFG